MARKNKADAAAPEAAIEQVEKPGIGFEGGIALATFFLLIGAIVLVYQANQTYLCSAATRISSDPCGPHGLRWVGDRRPRTSAMVCGAACILGSCWVGAAWLRRAINAATRAACYALPRACGESSTMGEYPTESVERLRWTRQGPLLPSLPVAAVWRRVILLVLRPASGCQCEVPWRGSW